jgi:hypothetical protein
MQQAAGFRISAFRPALIESTKLARSSAAGKKQTEDYITGRFG